ncbi:hypothetical protein L1887_05112 [Cichorium endivia]|nr:hypothetical protein L1887_05112 [Cichorium endivia]
MDPCPYVRIVVGSLRLKFNGGGAGTTPPSTCYCKIKLKNDTTQFVDITSIADGDVNQVNDQVQACFNLKKSDFDELVDKSNVLKIEVYSGRRSKSVCGFGTGKLLGVVTVGLDSEAVAGGGGNRGCVMVRDGWVGIGDQNHRYRTQRTQKAGLTVHMLK